MTHEHIVDPCLGWLPQPVHVACDPEQDDADWPYDSTCSGPAGAARALTSARNPQGLPLVRGPGR